LFVPDETGKFYSDGAERKSSDESLDEGKQKLMWELSGGYTHLEGFAPLEVPPPPVEPEEPAPNGEVAVAAKEELAAEKVADNTEAVPAKEKGDADEGKKEGEHKAAVEEDVKKTVAVEEGIDVGVENIKKSEVSEVIENKEVAVE